MVTFSIFIENLSSSSSLFFKLFSFKYLYYVYIFMLNNRFYNKKQKQSTFDEFLIWSKLVTL